MRNVRCTPTARRTNNREISCDFLNVNRKLPPKERFQIVAQIKCAFPARSENSIPV